MLNDVLLSQEEESQITAGTDDARRSALMLQMLVPFEITNPPRLRHLLFRSHLLYRVILRDSAVLDDIRRRCRNIDIGAECQKACGLPFNTWLSLIFAVYSYYGRYVHLEAGKVTQSPEHFLIDPNVFVGKSAITSEQLALFLRPLVWSLEELTKESFASRPADIRYDFVPFKSRPLWKVENGKIACLDLAFLAEKLHTGVFWLIHDRLSEERRSDLFKAWGILFERYVNWLFAHADLGPDILFFSFPSWARDKAESFDGILRKGSLLVVMEYKGGFLSQEAKYSASLDAFTADLDRKIGDGCRQLARKLHALFNPDRKLRKQLKDVPVEGVTRVLPVLIVQDHIARGPLVNWWLNRLFSRLRSEFPTSAALEIMPLNVVHAHELESLLATCGPGGFDPIYGLHHRAVRDPEMLGELHNFLFTIPGYGQVNSPLWRELDKQVWKEIASELFPKDWKPLENG